mgnify:CR=1 FL=1
MGTNNDMTNANQTFAGFTALVKWGTIAAVVVTAFVVFLIA